MLEDVQKCVKEFGIHDNVTHISLLADGPDHPVPYDVIRKIIRVYFENNACAVIKYVREPIFNPTIINNQCAFSDLLGHNGIRVPKRWKQQDSYCIKYVKDNLEMDVYIEEFFPDMIPTMTIEIFTDVGRLMGRMHYVSQCLKPIIGYSMLYNEVLYKDTSYERIWNGQNHSFIDEKNLIKLLQTYSLRIEIIKSVWSILPRGAVQGDIYSRNNIAISNGEVAVFDFNLAGDEVFIGDCLLCWFRTIFDEKIQEEIKNIDRDDLWNAYWSGYLKERQLSSAEKKHFSDIYAILGCLYYTKLLVCYVRTGRAELAKHGFKNTFKLLEVGNEVVPSMGEI